MSEETHSDNSKPDDEGASPPDKKTYSLEELRDIAKLPASRARPAHLPDCCATAYGSDLTFSGREDDRLKGDMRDEDIILSPLRTHKDFASSQTKRPGDGKNMFDLKPGVGRWDLIFGSNGQSIQVRGGQAAAQGGTVPPGGHEPTSEPGSRNGGERDRSLPLADGRPFREPFRETRFSTGDPVRDRELQQEQQRDGERELRNKGVRPTESRRKDDWRAPLGRGKTEPSLLRPNAEGGGNEPPAPRQRLAERFENHEDLQLEKDLVPVNIENEDDKEEVVTPFSGGKVKASRNQPKQETTTATAPTPTTADTAPLPTISGQDITDVDSLFADLDNKPVDSLVFDQEPTSASSRFSRWVELTPDKSPTGSPQPAGVNAHAPAPLPPGAGGTATTFAPTGGTSVVTMQQLRGITTSITVPNSGPVSTGLGPTPHAPHPHNEAPMGPPPVPTTPTSTNTGIPNPTANAASPAAPTPTLPFTLLHAASTIPPSQVLDQSQPPPPSPTLNPTLAASVGVSHATNPTLHASSQHTSQIIQSLIQQHPQYTTRSTPANVAAVPPSPPLNPQQVPTTPPHGGQLGYNVKHVQNLQYQQQQQQRGGQPQAVLPQQYAHHAHMPTQHHKPQQAAQPSQHAQLAQQHVYAVFQQQQTHGAAQHGHSLNPTPNVAKKIGHNMNPQQLFQFGGGQVGASSGVKVKGNEGSGFDVSALSQFLGGGIPAAGATAAPASTPKNPAMGIVGVEELEQQLLGSK